MRSPIGFQMYFQSIELEGKLKCGLSADSFLKCTLAIGIMSNYKTRLELWSFVTNPGDFRVVGDGNIANQSPPEINGLVFSCNC